MTENEDRVGETWVDIVVNKFNEHTTKIEALEKRLDELECKQHEFLVAIMNAPHFMKTDGKPWEVSDFTPKKKDDSKK